MAEPVGGTAFSETSLRRAKTDDMAAYRSAFSFRGEVEQIGI
jgi:hypothetical protein